ncbi:uncharacterized protein LOC131024978 [Salvia miltiorrhiza]|uniref:uncharacterized protein LOC131024978 n=1 Tax=Salvia miltiorrhiza TaxID=226208 RepID=UPI0025AC6986|nr:uncharacterized protein LOC131024978 [Salvia miltiorrhiza]
MAALLAYYLVLYLYLHACTARLLMVLDKKSVAGQLQFRSKESNIVDQLDNNKFLSAQNNEGKTTKGSQSWKILHHRDTEAKIWKRRERMMVSDAEENVSAKDKGAVEDIVVMDYAQPHRKPPIHNKGT